MKQRTEAIRNAARSLLQEGKVYCVVGYTTGTFPLRAQPYIAYTPEEVDKLVWNSFCGGNLATIARTVAKEAFGSAQQGVAEESLSDVPHAIAVVAQGCVSRNLVGLIAETQFARDELVVLGVPCLGMLDWRKVEAKVAASVSGHVLSVQEHEDSIIVSVRDAMGDIAELEILRRDVKRDNCYTCLHRNPVLADELMADPVEETAGGNIDFVAGVWEKFDANRRWQEFEKTFEDCIRCYACRDVCPLCYCTTCFVDEATPQWCGKTQDAADVQTFHLLRAFHCVGRCTDCGACETSCPQGIKMRRLTSKQEKDVRSSWQYEAGMLQETQPPLATYQIDDPEDRLLNGVGLLESDED